MPHIQTLELVPEYGKFVFEPLEKGYGHTIGNALRRVMLSSIPGVAVTAIRVQGAPHEFSALPGVKEDVTQLILNLKDLAILAYNEVPITPELTLTLQVKGAGRVTGADINCPDGISIVNPECYLATISDESVSLNIDFFVGRGTGYLLPDKHEHHKGIIGIIPVGTQFTPVRKVNYTVEQTRIGMQTDFDRLILEVWTNGTVAPNDAITQSSQILDKYFKMFFELGRMDNSLSAEEIEEENILFAHIPESRIEELNFSQRTFNCLRRANINNLRALAQVTENDLNMIRGFGRKSLNEVRDKLAEYGVELKLSMENEFIDNDMI